MTGYVDLVKNRGKAFTVPAQTQSDAAVMHHHQFSYSAVQYSTMRCSDSSYSKCGVSNETTARGPPLITARQRQRQRYVIHPSSFDFWTGF